jgi:hypothetical protein
MTACFILKEKLLKYKPNARPGITVSGSGMALSVRQETNTGHLACIIV